MSGARPAGTRRSPAWLVLHMRELFAKILGHLSRDTAALLSLASASKPLRRHLLPLLVRYFDLPLTRADAARRFLEAAPPEVIDSLAFLRIREDEAATKFRHRPHSEPTEHKAPQDPTFWKWDDDVSKILVLLEGRKKTPLPWIDLSMCLSDTSYVCTAFRKAPRLAERVCALRVIVDIDREDYEDRYEDDYGRWRAIRSTTSICWDALQELVQRLASKQLTVFELDNSAVFQFRGGDGYRHTLPPPHAWWRTMNEKLSETVQDLSLTLCGREQEDEWGGLERTFGADWPVLRKVSLACCDSDADELGRLVDAFLRRNGSKLEEAAIEFPTFGPLRLDYDLPRLRSLAITGTLDDEDQFKAPLSSFAGRHAQTISELCLLDRSPHAGKILLAHPRSQTLLNGLRVLRGSRRVARHLIRMGAKPAHLQLDTVDCLDSLQLEDVVMSKAARKALTCLEVEVNEESFAEMIVQLGHAFSTAVFPSLQELVLCSTAAHTQAYKDDAQAVMESAMRLRLALLALRTATSLRALRIEHMGAVCFPPGDLEPHIVRKCPPALEYLTWHVPKRNASQYYRIVREGGVAVRVARLPASFRVRIDAGTGVWEQKDLERGAALFDHSRGGRPDLVLQ